MGDDRFLAGSRKVHASFYATTDMLAKVAYYSYQSYLPPRMGSADMPDPWGAAWFGLSTGAVISGRQIPVGVLIQHMSPADLRPLQLTVHFSQRYPDEACPYVASSRHKQHLIFNPRHMYFNSLKEALLIRTGRATQVLELVEADREQLWLAARDGDLEAHRTRLSRLKHAAVTRPGQDGAQVPLRVLVAEGTAENWSLRHETVDVRSTHERQTLRVQGMEERGFYSRPVLAEFPDGTPMTLLDAVYSICPEAIAAPVSCRLRTDESSAGPAAVRLDCHVQLLVEEVGGARDEGQEALERAAGAAERPSPSPDGACAGESAGGDDAGAGSAGAAELPGAAEGGADEGQGAAIESAAAEGGVAEGDAADSAAPVLSHSAAEGGGASGADVKDEEAVPAGGEDDGGGAADGAVAGQPDAGGGDVREEVEGGGDGAGGGAGVQAVEGGPVESTPTGSAATMGPGKYRTPLRRVVKGRLREGVSVYVGGVRAHVQDDVLRAGVRLLHDVLFAPDLFLYVVIQFSRDVDGSL